MRLTATNGSAAKGFSGQRVTVTMRGDRDKVTVHLPSGNALQRGTHTPQLLELVRVRARTECTDRAGIPRRGQRQAWALINLFAECKARLMVLHGRRSIGHAE